MLRARGSLDGDGVAPPTDAVPLSRTGVVGLRPGSTQNKPNRAGNPREIRHSADSGDPLWLAHFVSATVIRTFDCEPACKSAP